MCNRMRGAAIPPLLTCPGSFPFAPQKRGLTDCHQQDPPLCRTLHLLARRRSAAELRRRFRRQDVPRLNCNCSFGTACTIGTAATVMLCAILQSLVDNRSRCDCTASTLGALRHAQRAGRRAGTVGYHAENCVHVYAPLLFPTNLTQ